MHFAVMFIGCSLFALQQLSGINAVFYFSSTVFESFGVPSDIANTCVGVCNLVGIVLLISFIFVYLLICNCCLFLSTFSCNLFRVCYCNDSDG